MIPPVNMASVKTWAIIAVVVLLLLAGLAYYFYSAGAAKTVITPLSEDNPGSTDPNNNPAGISDADAKTLAASIYNEISGYHPLGHDDGPYDQLLALSDTDFERVYNDFNTSYQQQLGNTLAAQVKSEWVVYDPAWDTLQTSMEERFAKLNLI